jgi:hypothetical protein
MCRGLVGAAAALAVRPAMRSAGLAAGRANQLHAGAMVTIDASLLSLNSTIL